MKREELRINVNKRKIYSALAVWIFIDADTLQHVIYMPSIELTAYGATRVKAEEMMRSALDDYFSYLINSSPEQIQTELSGLGWKKNPIFSKEYSKAFVDIDGGLKNLNAVDNKIEQATLVTS